MRRAIRALMGHVPLREWQVRLRRKNRSYLLPLVYHHVAEPGEYGAFQSQAHQVSPAAFEAQLGLLLEAEIPVVALNGQSLAAGLNVALTFDDGFASIFQHALPLMLKRRLPFTVFATGRPLAGKFIWRDVVYHALATERVDEYLGLGSHPSIEEEASPAQIAALRQNLRARSKDPRYFYLSLATILCDAYVQRAGLAELQTTLYMTPDQLVEILQAGGQLGNHTQSHPLLAVLNWEQLSLELQRCNQALRPFVGEGSIPFAVPFGDPEMDTPFQVDASREFNLYPWCRMLPGANRGNARTVCRRSLAPSREGELERMLSTLCCKLLFHWPQTS